MKNNINERESDEGEEEKTHLVGKVRSGIFVKRGAARVWGGDTGVLAHVGPAASLCLLSVGGVYRVVLKAKRPFCAALFFALM